MKLTVRKDIAALRRDAVNRINELCGQVRARFVTIIPAQDMIYLEKASEGRRFLAEHPDPQNQPAEVDPDPSMGFPFIASEVGITAATGFEVAMFYVQGAAQFRYVGAAIEAIRLGSMQAVEAAETPDQIAATVDVCAAQLAELPIPSF
jgi:hypothetical protein